MLYRIVVTNCSNPTTSYQSSRAKHNKAARSTSLATIADIDVHLGLLLAALIQSWSHLNGSSLKKHSLAVSHNLRKVLPDPSTLTSEMRSRDGKTIIDR